MTGLGSLESANCSGVQIIPDIEDEDIAFADQSRAVKAMILSLGMTPFTACIEHGFKP
jgi:hypothetical protein